MIGTPESCAVSPVAAEVVLHDLADFADMVLSPLAPTILGSSASTTSASVPSSDRSLPRMISLLSTRWISSS